MLGRRRGAVVLGRGGTRGGAVTTGTGAALRAASSRFAPVDVDESPCPVPAVVDDVEPVVESCCVRGFFTGVVEVSVASLAPAAPEVVESASSLVLPVGLVGLVIGCGPGAAASGSV
jgi:hypothetical protein